MASCHDLVLVIAAGQDHRDAGSEFAQHRQCFPAVHPRHRQVAKDATDFTPVLTEHFQGVDAILRFKNGKSQTREHGRPDVANPLLVIDQQHRAGSFHFRSSKGLVRCLR